MKTILIINDNSPEAIHAAEFGLALAKRMQANIMLANNFSKVQKYTEKVQVFNSFKTPVEDDVQFNLKDTLSSKINNKESFAPSIDELDISYMSETQLADIINKKQIWMMVKGMADIQKVTANRSLNIHSVLNRVLCPLLIIPAAWNLKNIDRLTYIADLRYCRLHLVQYLAAFAKSWNADVSVAHLSASGLPDMAEGYAETVFNDEIANNVKYDRLFFNNIKEKDLGKAVDVIVNGMHSDMLVMVNHRYHFEEILGRYITDTLPQNVNTPVLVFPY